MATQCNCKIPTCKFAPVDEISLKPCTAQGDAFLHNGLRAGQSNFQS